MRTFTARLAPMQTFLEEWIDLSELAASLNEAVHEIMEPEIFGPNPETVSFRTRRAEYVIGFEGEPGREWS